MLNNETVKQIKKSEGLRLKAYPDPGSKDGLPITIGYGTTRINGRPVNRGEVITQSQADDYFEKDINQFAKKVEALVKVKLNANQFGALVSFAYNVGIGAFASSTLLKLLNAGDYNAVPSQLRRWNKNDGKVMQGLINRREEEIKLWLKPTVEPVQGGKTTKPSNGSTNAGTTLLELLIQLINQLFGRK